MNKVKIDKNSRVLIEDNNYTLEYRVPKGDFRGKKGVGFKWQLGGYFPTMEQLLNDWVRNAPSKQKDGQIKELKDIVDCIKNAEQHIAKLLK